MSTKKPNSGRDRIKTVGVNKRSLKEDSDYPIVNDNLPPNKIRTLTQTVVKTAKAINKGEIDNPAEQYLLRYLAIIGYLGERAYIMPKEGSKESNAYNLCIEVPLLMTHDDEVAWLITARNFFRELCNRIVVNHGSNQGKDIQDLPLEELTKLLPSHVDFKKYVEDSLDWGTRPKAQLKIQYRIARNLWIKARYRALRKKMLAEYPSYETIQKELAAFPIHNFGHWPEIVYNDKGKLVAKDQKDPRHLSIPTIKRIANHNSSQ